MTQVKDKYDAAIEYLTEHPAEITTAFFVDSHPARCLFQFATPSGRTEMIEGKECGCPVLIRASPQHQVAFTTELTRKIAADERLPKYSIDITLAHLPTFAEWQRRLDRELGRAL